MTDDALCTEAEYVPGRWVGMAAPRMWLVADLDPRDPVVAACWALVTAAASFDDVLAALLEARIRPALNLAMVRLDGNAADVLVRGDAWAEIAHEPAAGQEPVDLRAGPGAFRDTRVDRFDVIGLHLPIEGPADEPPPLAVATAVVPAARIAIHARPAGPPVPARHDAPGRAPGPAPQTAPDASVEAPAPAGGHEQAGGRFVAMFGKTVHPTEQEAGASPVPDAWMAGMRRPVGSVPAAAPVPGGVAPPDGPSTGATPPHTTAAPPSMMDYRSPFEAAPGARSEPGLPAAQLPPVAGASLFTDVSWAEVAEVPAAGPDPYQQYHAAHPAPTSYQPPATFQIPPPPVLPAATPAPVVASPPAPPPVVSAPAAGGIDPELMWTVQRAPSRPEAAAGPMVSAVRCPVNHPNPPTAGRCRICGTAISPQTPEPMVRPTLGLLRLSTGEVVPLDRGVILGRAPGAPQGFGRDEPYRIQLPSPDGSISRRHVEVVLQEWSVSVVDLNSTNGTVVFPPGRPPEQLASGAARVIDNGWTVSLDSQTSFRFEVTE